MEKQNRRHDTALKSRQEDKPSLLRCPRSAAKAGTEERCSPLQQLLIESPEPPLKGPAYTLPEMTLRRGLKTCGQIGESGRRDKFSYLSLVR